MDKSFIEVADGLAMKRRRVVRMDLTKYMQMITKEEDRERAVIDIKSVGWKALDRYKPGPKGEKIFRTPIWPESLS